MSLHNLLDTIVQTKTAATISVDQMADILNLSGWQPTKQLVRPQKPAIKALVESTVTDDEVERQAKSYANGKARNAVLEGANENTRLLMRYLNDYSYKLDSQEPISLEEYEIKSVLNRKDRHLLPKIISKSLIRRDWDNLVEDYREKYGLAIKEVDRKQISTEIKTSRKESAKRDAEYSERNYSDSLANYKSDKDKYSALEQNSYIAWRSLSKISLFSGLIANTAFQSSRFAKHGSDYNYVRLKPIALTNVSELFEDSAKFKGQYVIFQAYIGNPTVDKRIDGHMSANSSSSLTTRTDAHSSSFLFFSDSDASSQSVATSTYSASAWIRETDKKIDLCISDMSGTLNAICTFKLQDNHRLCAYKFDKEKKFLSYNTDIPAIALALRTAESRNTPILVGGTIDENGSFTMDNLLLSYSGMTHNFGYLETF